jgi:hypothetical protein
VVPEYSKKVVELTAGPCIAIEVVGDVRPAPPARGADAAQRIC